MLRLDVRGRRPASWIDWIRTGRLVYVLLIVAGSLYFTDLGAAPVSNPDEGLYAEVPREMLESGDVVTPHFNYARYPDKPPLLYWLTAGSYWLWGESEFTARLASAAAGVLGVWAVFLLGRALFDPATALLAAFVYATSMGTLVFSRYLQLDQLLATLIALALLAEWRLLAADRAVPRFAWALLAGACAGAAVMTKGLIGLAVPAGTLLVACAWDRRIRNRIRAAPLAVAFAAFAIVVLPWHLIAYLRDPESIQLLIVNEQVHRFLDHREPHDYQSLSIPAFLAVALAWNFPWCFFLPAGLAAARPSRAYAAMVPAIRYVLAWVAVTLGIFVLSQCRLPHYSLPAVPALSLLVAAGWRFHSRRGRAERLPSLLLAIGCTAVLVGCALDWAPVAGAVGSPRLLRLGVVGLVLLAAGAWGAFAGLRKERPGRALCALGVAATLLAAVSATALSTYQSKRSFDRIVRALPAGPGTIILAQPEEYESLGALCFYAHRKIRVLEHAGRPESSVRLAPSERFFLGPEEFRALWNYGDAAWFITDPGDGAVPPVAGLSVFREVGRQQGRIIFANR